LSALLQSLLDRQAITEVLFLYCRACDRADEALLRSCFHADSQHRHGGFEGLSEDFCVMAMRIISAAKVTKHVLTNVQIELDGDTAQSEAYYHAYHRVVDRRSGLEEDNFSGGRYLDRFERRDGRWRIAQRVGLIDFERFDAPTDRGLPGLPAAARSRRLPDDELYAVLGIAGARRLP
jgi:hypothetical protein